ncbi:hypothetical protein KFL_001180080 [Klebsormidium nitens]|uniref:Uncharacterized protein n=1 Tax=Klebsormidium nitens TaxID=105231 RepID=A0A1Y1HZL2_KLENI|nr:hypothetical protein KFL_001180080 [Klebsormidium nitens]|eukprot:GAQ82629.1 hypothetical protein KFL_001180080 [Klebsormidium nitens]
MPRLGDKNAAQLKACYNGRTPHADGQVRVRDSEAAVLDTWEDLLTCSSIKCQHFVKVASLLVELMCRNAVENGAALEAIAFLLDSGLQEYAATKEETNFQAALLELCNAVTTCHNKTSLSEIVPLSSRAGLAEELWALLCRLLLQADSLPALQDAASVALQKLSLQLPRPGRLALHSSILGVLSAAAGQLSTTSIVNLLNLLAGNAASGGYLTQQTAQELRMLALVKDQSLSAAASKTVAALPVKGSVLTAAEEKFVFLERTLLPWPVLKRASEQESPAIIPERCEPFEPASIEVSESPEKHILLSPYPFVPCRAATRQVLRSGDQQEFSSDPLARKTPPRGSQIQSEAPASPLVLHPSPLSPKKSAGPPRSPLSSKSPTFSRSRDLARVAASKSPQKEQRALSPPTKNQKLTPTGAAKKVLFSTDGTSKDLATRSPLREKVAMQRSSGGGQGPAPSSPLDRPSSSRTLGQVANHFEARKEVWKKTAAKKKESDYDIPKPDAQKDIVSAGVQVSSPNGSFTGAELEGVVEKPPEGSAALLKPVEVFGKAAMHANTIDTSEVVLEKQTATWQYDTLSAEEWLQLAKLEESSAAEDSIKDSNLSE